MDIIVLGAPHELLLASAARLGLSVHALPSNSDVPAALRAKDDKEVLVLLEPCCLVLNRTEVSGDEVRVASDDAGIAADPSVFVGTAANVARAIENPAEATVDPYLAVSPFLDRENPLKRVLKPRVFDLRYDEDGQITRDEHAVSVVVVKNSHYDQHASLQYIAGTCGITARPPAGPTIGWLCGCAWVAIVLLLLLVVVLPLQWMSRGHNN